MKIRFPLFDFYISFAVVTLQRMGSSPLHIAPCPQASLHMDTWEEGPRSLLLHGESPSCTYIQEEDRRGEPAAAAPGMVTAGHRGRPPRQRSSQAVASEMVASHLALAPDLSAFPDFPPGSEQAKELSASGRVIIRVICTPWTWNCH